MFIKKLYSNCIMRTKAKVKTRKTLKIQKNKSESKKNADVEKPAKDIIAKKTEESLEEKIRKIIKILAESQLSKDFTPEVVNAQLTQYQSSFQYDSNIQYGKSSSNDQQTNFYEIYSNRSEKIEVENHISEDSIRDITEDKKLASTGEFNGSGKYVRVETRQQFEDYKLSFENFIWLRVKYDLSLT